MKKEYHLTITRKDRIYLVIFVTALLGWELTKLVLPFPGPNSSETISSIAIVSVDSIQNEKNEKDERIELPSQGYFNQGMDERNASDATPVPIMTAGIEELTRIGFSKKVAYNIQKYISAGGQIKDEKSLKKIYGVDTSTLSEILPFIIFPLPSRKDSTSIQSFEKKEFTYALMDLNAVTEEDLDKLPGIGEVLASRIIKFRTSLGGFASLDQLKDCYGITPETLEKIKPRLNIIQPQQQFSINEIDPKTFSHPYLPKRIMWMIPNYIKNHGPIENQEDLRKVFPPDSNWCEKLLPYIRF